MAAGLHRGENRTLEKEQESQKHELESLKALSRLCPILE